MKIETTFRQPNGTVLFVAYKTFHSKSGAYSHHNGEAYGYTEMFTTPEEYFARYPEASMATLCRVEDGQLVHGCGHYNRGGSPSDYFCAPYAAQIAAQQAAAEQDGSMAAARQQAAATERAETLSVVTAETHEPVAGENFRRWSKRDLPAIVQAKRRAVALGFDAVILHNLPGEKYGMRWSPAQPKSNG